MDLQATVIFDWVSHLIRSLVHVLCTLRVSGLFCMHMQAYIIHTYLQYLPQFMGGDIRYSIDWKRQHMCPTCWGNLDGHQVFLFLFHSRLLSHATLQL
jgi:hypothetical protein